MRPNRRLETFESNFAKVLERQCFSFAQFGNDVRYQNLFFLRVRTKPGSELDGAAKQIVVMFDRFACGDAKPDTERTIFVFPAVSGNLALDAAGAFNGSGRGYERCHDTVSQMLDFAATQIG